MDLQQNRIFQVIKNIKGNYIQTFFIIFFIYILFLIEFYLNKLYNVPKGIFKKIISVNNFNDSLFYK